MLIKVKAEENSKSLQDLSADAAVLYKKALRQTIHLFDREIELSKNERIWLEDGIWYWGTVINNVLHVIPIQKGKISKICCWHICIQIQILQQFLIVSKHLHVAKRDLLQIGGKPP